jgi:hypothetical protein
MSETTVAGFLVLVAGQRGHFRLESGHIIRPLCGLINLLLVQSLGKAGLPPLLG